MHPLAQTMHFWILVAICIASANAHGFVHSLSIDGKEYPGWSPFTDPYLSPSPAKILRQIPSDGPVTSVQSSDLACNGNIAAALIADVQAGSQVVFNWDYWPGDHQGPVWTFMSSCNGDCINFDASGARWFKIDAAGYEDGRWAAARLIANGASWTSTIPYQLAPGQYLLRHEIVALHSAGQPQFYPSCSQVNVVGSGTSYPSESELISIPGVFDNVIWPNIDTSFGTFDIPGPPPVLFGGEAPSPNTPPSASPPPPPLPSPAAESEDIGTGGGSSMTSRPAVATYKPTSAASPTRPTPLSTEDSLPVKQQYCRLSTLGEPASQRLLTRRSSESTTMDKFWSALGLISRR